MPFLRLTERPPGHRGRRVQTRGSHESVRPQCGRPRLIGGTVRMHGQIDDEFIRPGPGERPGCSTDLDLPQHGHLHLVLPAARARCMGTTTGVGVPWPIPPAHRLDRPLEQGESRDIVRPDERQRHGDGKIQVGLLGQEDRLPIHRRIHQRGDIPQVHSFDLLRPHHSTEQLERRRPIRPRKAHHVPASISRRDNGDAESRIRGHFEQLRDVSVGDRRSAEDDHRIPSVRRVDAPRLGEGIEPCLAEQILTPESTAEQAIELRREVLDPCHPVEPLELCSETDSLEVEATTPVGGGQFQGQRA